MIPSRLYFVRRPDLGGFFEAFSAPKIHGLASVRDCRIDILAVNSVNPGHGDFCEFIENLKANYSTIAIWEIRNGSLAAMLRRWSFRDVREVVDAELSTGMRWDRHGAPT